MGKIFKAILEGFSSVIDITGSIGKEKINKLFHENINHGFSTDKKNISRDIGKIVKK